MGEVNGSHTRYCKTAPGPQVRAASGSGGGSGFVKRPRPRQAGPGRDLFLPGPAAALLPCPGLAPHSPVGCGKSSGASGHSGKGRDAGSMAALTVAADGCALRRRFRKFGHCRFVFVKSVMMISPARRKVPGKRRVGLAGGFSRKRRLASSLDLNLNLKNKQTNTAGASHPDPLFPYPMVGGKVAKAPGLSWRNDCSSKNCIYLVGPK